VPSKSDSTMPLENGWQPFRPSVGVGRPTAVDKVTVYRGGNIRISGDLVERLGKPARLQLLTNGAANAFGICSATTPAGAVALSKGHHQNQFRATRLFASLKKDTEQITWPLDLPHSWEGDILVIDISDIPNGEVA
jgi:hypothetical protein